MRIARARATRGGVRRRDVDADAVEGHYFIRIHETADGTFVDADAAPDAARRAR